MYCRNSPSSDYESRAERNPMLWLLYERTLFKSNANTPALEVFQNEPPRKEVIQPIPLSMETSSFILSVLDEPS